MKIIVDENIKSGKEAFSLFGDVILINGRKISKETVADADILITRSVTKVNFDLLEKSKVKFVGTATIGTDHIDLDYLKSNGIAFANAPGCNSYSVAEYVFAALLELADKYNFKLNEKSIGVVGVGNIGSKVVRFANALGMKILINDPPLEREGTGEGYSTLDEVLKCDVVTLHVPLNKGGTDNTYHLIGEKELLLMNNDSILINASRGEIVNNRALLEALEKNKIKAILDVWENEPTPLPELVEKVEIGTPHIAGYSLDGKLNGTKMVFEALNNFLGTDYKFPEDKNKFKKTIDCSSESVKEKILRCAFCNVYNVSDDDKRFRKIFAKGKNVAEEFDLLRKNYHRREEFCNFAISIKEKRMDVLDLLTSFRLTISEQ